MATLSENLMIFAKLMNEIEENNGEIPSELIPALSQSELAISEKIDNYVGFRDVIQGQIERTKKTIENFKKTLTSLENIDTRLKNHAKHAMEAHDLLSISGNERSIKLVNSGGVQATEKPSDMFYQEECVDAKYFAELKDYITSKIVHIIKDKDEFKQAIKDNKIKSCFLLPRSKYVKFI